MNRFKEALGVAVLAFIAGLTGTAGYITAMFWFDVIFIWGTGA